MTKYTTHPQRGCSFTININSTAAAAAVAAAAHTTATTTTTTTSSSVTSSTQQPVSGTNWLQTAHI